MPITSISSRPASMIARNTLRPMRPNPLIPTRMDIPDAPLRGARTAAPALIYALARGPATANAGGGTAGLRAGPDGASLRGSRDLTQRRLDDLVHRNPEVPI